MKRILSVVTAALFAGALALPALAQVGAGVAGNATVGQINNHVGANADVANSDAERAEPASPTDTSPTVIRRHARRSENPAENPSPNAFGPHRGIDASATAGVTPSDMSRADTDVKHGIDDSPTGGY